MSTLLQTTVYTRDVNQSLLQTVHIVDPRLIRPLLRNISHSIGFRSALSGMPWLWRDEGRSYTLQLLNSVCPCILPLLKFPQVVYKH